MKVVYLLEGSALYGGVKVVYQHARALRRVGVEAEVVCPEPPSPWFAGVTDFFRQVEALDPFAVGATDVVVATMWRTVPVAVEVAGAMPFHLCQCYEGLYDGVRDQWQEIEDVYRLPTRKLAVSPHLVSLIESRFGQRALWVPQPFEAHRFHPPPDEAPRRDTLRVALFGHWDLDLKGVQWGMRALRPLGDEGWLELVRVSLEAPAEELALWPDAERHLHVSPEDVPAVLRGVDVYLGLCDEVEGFGLPALEAMGCGRACVLTDIGATRSLDPDSAACLKIPVGDERALRRAVRKLHAEPSTRRRLGEAGRAIAVGFSEERTAAVLVRAFEEACRASS